MSSVIFNKYRRLDDIWNKYTNGFTNLARSSKIEHGLQLMHRLCRQDPHFEEVVPMIDDLWAKFKECKENWYKYQREENRPLIEALKKEGEFK